MFPYPLDKIDAVALAEICAQHFSESETVDFKQELTKSSDAGKNELAKDVSTMANASGGDLIFGLREQKGDGETPGGAAEAVTPIQGESFEEVQRRFVQGRRICSRLADVHVIACQWLLSHLAVFGLAAKNLVEVHPAMRKTIGGAGQVDLPDSVMALVGNSHGIKAVRFKIVRPRIASACIVPPQ